MRGRKSGRRLPQKGRRGDVGGPGRFTATSGESASTLRTSCDSTETDFATTAGGFASAAPGAERPPVRKPRATRPAPPEMMRMQTADRSKPQPRRVKRVIGGATRRRRIYSSSPNPPARDGLPRRPEILGKRNPELRRDMGAARTYLAGIFTGERGYPTAPNATFEGATLRGS